MIDKRECVFRGNEKQVFATSDPHMVIFRYTDVTVAYNNIKRARFKGKGALDNRISALLLDYLNENGVDTHYVKTLAPDEQLCRKIEIIPLQVVIHNRIAGSLAVRLGVDDGFRPANTVVDLRYNNDELEDPFINRDHAVALGLATYQELDGMPKGLYRVDLQAFARTNEDMAAWNERNAAFISTVIYANGAELPVHNLMLHTFANRDDYNFLRPNINGANAAAWETPEGSFVFIADYENFEIPQNVIVIGIENMENFRYIRQQKNLFKK